MIPLVVSDRCHSTMTQKALPFLSRIGTASYVAIDEEVTAEAAATPPPEAEATPNGKAAAPPPRTTTTAAPKLADAAPGTGRAREDNRRRILQEELESEQKRLVEAKQKLAEQQPARPGETGSVLPRIKPFIEAVELAEKNVVQLRRELSNIK